MITPAKALTQRIRELRRRHFGPRGKAEFARRLGVSPEEYERYERGTVPPGEVLIRMCELSGEDLQWLLVGIPSRQTVVISGARSRHQELLIRLARLLDGSPELAAPVEAFVDLLARGQEVQAAVAPRLPGPSWPELIPIFSPEDLPRVLPERADDGFGREFALALSDAALAVAGHESARLAEPAGQYDDAAFRSVELVTVAAEPGRPRQFLRSRDIPACLPGVFGIQVTDDEMSPMFRTGDAVLAAIGAPPRIGRPALCRLDGPPHVRYRVWLGQDETSVHLGRLVNGELERIPRTRVCWSLEVLYRLTRAA